MLLWEMGKITQKYYDKKNAVHVDNELPSIIYVHVFCCLMTKSSWSHLCGIPHKDQNINTWMAMTLLSIPREVCSVKHLRIKKSTYTVEGIVQMCHEIFEFLSHDIVNQSELLPYNGVTN